MIKQTPQQKYIEESIAQWDEDFKNHQARIIESEIGTLVLWAKPGSWVHAVEYVIRGRYLYVGGDIGAATFRWPGAKIELPFLANQGLSYFKSKCRASESGRDFETWNRDVAMARLEEEVALEREEGEAPEYAAMLERAIKELPHSSFEWMQWVGKNVNEVFGGEEAGHVANCGVVPDSTAIGMWRGLKLAAEALGLREAA